MGRASISTENPAPVNRIIYTETIYITRMLQYKMLLKCQNFQNNEYLIETRREQSLRC